MYSDFALNQSHQDTSMALADHGVTLPVTEAPLTIDNGRALIDRDLIGDRATPAVGAVALAPGLLTAQRLVQFAT